MFQNMRNLFYFMLPTHTHTHACLSLSLFACVCVRILVAFGLSAYVDRSRICVAVAAIDNASELVIACGPMLACMCVRVCVCVCVCVTRKVQNINNNDKQLGNSNSSCFSCLPIQFRCCCGRVSNTPTHTRMASWSALCSCIKGDKARKCE